MEDDPFFLGSPIFSGELLVLECIFLGAAPLPATQMKV